MRAITSISADQSEFPVNPRDRFAALQAEMLAFYGLNAVSRYVTLQAPPIRLHMLEAGSGEPAIIFHGGDGQGIDWAPLMSELQRDLHMFAVDRPGFGLSDPFDYRGVDLRQHAAQIALGTLDALGLERATLIGGSMGGLFALAAALAAPDRVRRVILVGMPVGLASSAPLLLRLVCAIPGTAEWMMRRLAKPGTQHRNCQYKNMFKTDVDRIPELYFEMQEAGLAIPRAPETWAMLLRQAANLRGMRPEVVLIDELADLTTPMLVLWGQRDMAPAKTGRAATARIPDARFIELGGVGHFPFLEDPDRCARLIREFISEPASQAAA